jgi:hypothetical protein
MAKTGKIKNWDTLSDEEILQIRVRDFHLQIPGSELEPLIGRLYQELDAKGISFHPSCYLADEWFCPEKVPIIGVPFCLAHPRLKHIEQKMLYEVEGGTEASCMRLLRHECGHALNYAYEVYKKTRWRELFGLFSARYSGSYYFQPYSRRFVIHLEDNYAQSHPDEDFAETFAVWLTPNSGWEQKYNGWPVMKKLRYVDNLMKRIGNQPPVNTVQERPPWSASRMTSTLAAHYERKRKALGTEFQGFYDDSLEALFASKAGRVSRASCPRSEGGTPSTRASRLLRHHRRELVDSVSRWTGHRKYDVRQLVNTLITRCDALDLYAKPGQTDNIVGLTALLTAIAGNTLKPFRRYIRQ